MSFGGHRPSAVGWLGIALVVAGCLMMLVESVKKENCTRYWNASSLWVLLTAAAITCYSIVDKIAAERMPAGAMSAARYAVLELSFAVPFLGLLLRCVPLSGSCNDRGHGWKWPAVVAAFDLGSYWLVLWAYQLTPQASYVLGLRQLSIPMGVLMGLFVLHERATLLRIVAAVLISAGAICIGTA